MFLSAENALKIVNEMKEAIHKDLNIMNQNGLIIASTNPTRIGQLHQGALELLHQKLPYLVIYQENAARGVQQGVNLPIVLNGETIGVIGITGAPEEVSVFGDIIKRMTEVMVEGMQTQEQLELLEQATGSFLESWLFAENPDWDALLVRGKLLGLDITQPYAVALIDLPHTTSAEPSDTPEDVQTRQLLRLLRQQQFLFTIQTCTVIQDQLLILLPGTSRSAVERCLFQLLQNIEAKTAHQVHGGASISNGQPIDLRRCYQEARIAAITAQRQGADRILFYDEASLEFIVTSIPGQIRTDLQSRILTQCGNLELRDISELIQLYFAENGDLQACADRLFIHRNTVQYRIEQIKKKTGYDLRYPRDACLLYFAFFNC